MSGAASEELGCPPGRAGDLGQSVVHLPFRAPQQRFGRVSNRAAPGLLDASSVVDQAVQSQPQHAAATDEVCCVCLEHFHVQATIRLPCGHRIHMICLEAYCKYCARVPQSFGCPICHCDIQRSSLHPSGSSISEPHTTVILELQVPPSTLFPSSWQNNAESPQSTAQNYDGLSPKENQFLLLAYLVSLLIAVVVVVSLHYLPSQRSVYSAPGGGTRIWWDLFTGFLAVTLLFYSARYVYWWYSRRTANRSLSAA